MDSNYKCFYNLTDIPIPKFVVETVKLGPNFSFPLLKKDMKDVVFQYIKDFEANICKIPETFQKVTHCSVSNKLSKIVTSLNIQDQTILKNLQLTELFLKHNPRIKIVKCDKSGAFVAIDKDKWNFG